MVVSRQAGPHPPLVPFLLMIVPGAGWRRVCPAGDLPDDVTGDVAAAARPLSGAERQARYKARKKAEKAAAGSGVQADGSWVAQFAGQRPAFPPGHELALTHGARQEVRVEALAAQVRAELLAHPDCPPYLREDGSYAWTLELWSSAVAVSRLLRAWLNAQDLADAMAEVTEEEETEERPTPVTVKRRMRSRRVQSVLDQLHKHETRAMHLATRLGLDPLARGRLGADLASAKFDLARYWAEQDAREQQAQERAAG